MSDTDVKVTFIGDAKQLSKVLGDLDKKAGASSGSLHRIGETMAGVFSANALQNGLSSVVNGLTGMLKAAAQDEAEQKKLAQTLLTVAGATTQQVAETEKWIDATQRATGVADSELRPALDKLVRSSSSVEEAQKNLKIAMDVSRGTGKDLDTVAQALAKVLEGNTTAAARLVPELTGIAREGASADEIMGALAKTFEGQTTVHAESTAGKMDRLNIAFDEMKEKVGAKLMPVVLDLGDWLIEKGIPKIEEIAGKVEAWWTKQDGLREAIKSGAEKLEALTLNLITFIGWVDSGIEKVDAFAKSLNSLPDKILGIRTGFGGAGTPNEQVKELRGMGLSDKDIKSILGDQIGPIGSFEHGGVVGGRGPVGSPQMIVAHKGEEFLGVNGQRGGGSQTIHLQLDSRTVFTWLVDASRDAGGIPLTLRSPS